VAARDRRPRGLNGGGGGAPRCQIEQRTVDLDDNEVTLGESHFVRGDGWVTTAWINFAPEGYTEDIVSTLWG
jgi:hypothetical protein